MDWRVYCLRRCNRRGAQQALEIFRHACPLTAAGHRYLGMLRLHLRSRSDLDRYAEPFIVRTTHGHANMHAAVAELQHIVCPGIGREPVMPLNVFAKSFEARKYVFLAMLFDVLNRFPIRLYYFQVPIVHPDAPLKVTLILL